MTLRECCCGCTLRTGTLIIGWLSLISQVGFLILFITGTTITNNDKAVSLSETPNLEIEFIRTSQISGLGDRKYGFREVPITLNTNSDLKDLFKPNNENSKPVDSINFPDLEDDLKIPSEVIFKFPSEDDDFKYPTDIGRVFNQHVIQFHQKILHQLGDESPIFGEDAISSRKRREIGDEDKSKNEDPMLITYAVASSILIVTSIILIVGATKGYMNFLLPWIYSVTLIIIMDIICMIINATQFTKNESEVFSEIVFLGLDFYMLMVVISHYKELKLKSMVESNIAHNKWAASTATMISIIPEKGV